MCCKQDECSILKPFDLETIRFISFYVVLNKHFGSVITRLGFDSHCKNPPAQFFFDSKDVMKYKSHFDTCFFEMRKKSHTLR